MEDSSVGAQLQSESLAAVGKLLQSSVRREQAALRRSGGTQTVVSTARKSPAKRKFSDVSVDSSETSLSFLSTPNFATSPKRRKTTSDFSKSEATTTTAMTSSLLPLPFESMEAAIDYSSLNAIGFDTDSESHSDGHRSADTFADDTDYHSGIPGIAPLIADSSANAHSTAISNDSSLHSVATGIAVDLSKNTHKMDKSVEESESDNEEEEDTGFEVEIDSSLIRAEDVEESGSESASASGKSKKKKRKDDGRLKFSKWQRELGVHLFKAHLILCIHRTQLMTALAMDPLCKARLMSLLPLCKHPPVTSTPTVAVLSSITTWFANTFSIHPKKRRSFSMMCPTFEQRLRCGTNQLNAVFNQRRGTQFEMALLLLALLWAFDLEAKLVHVLRPLSHLPQKSGLFDDTVLGLDFLKHLNKCRVCGKGFEGDSSFGPNASGSFQRLADISSAVSVVSKTDSDAIVSDASMRKSSSGVSKGSTAAMAMEHRVRGDRTTVLSEAKRKAMVSKAYALQMSAKAKAKKKKLKRRNTMNNMGSAQKKKKRKKLWFNDFSTMKGSQRRECFDESDDRLTACVQVWCRFRGVAQWLHVDVGTGVIHRDEVDAASILMSTTVPKTTKNKSAKSATTTVSSVKGDENTTMTKVVSVSGKRKSAIKLKKKKAKSSIGRRKVKAKPKKRKRKSKDASVNNGKEMEAGMISSITVQTPAASGSVRGIHFDVLSKCDCRGGGRLAYVVSVDKFLRVSDVSARYGDAWSKVRRIRGAQFGHFFDEYLLLLESAHQLWVCRSQMYDACYSPRRLRLEEKESQQLAAIKQNEDVPEIASHLRNHHLYCIEKFVKRYECVYPNDADFAVGRVQGHWVFPISHLRELHTKDRWFQEARVVRSDETPVKVVRKHFGNCDTDVTQLFGDWQCDEYVPREPNADGKVPKNERGNIELFTDRHLAKGCAHIRHSLAWKSARKLKVDYAKALVGFDFSKGKNHPVFDGVVVCEQFADEVLDVCVELEATEMQRAKDKETREMFGLWKTLVTGVLVRQQLADERKTQQRRDKERRHNADDLALSF